MAAKKNVDMVNHPPHYMESENGIECIDAIEASGNLKGFCLGNVAKYLWRFENREGLEDLKKAQWYLNKYIQYVEYGPGEFVNNNSVEEEN